MALRGLHVNVLDSATLATLRRARPALVKTLDTGQDWGRLKAESDIRFLLARVHLDDVATLSPSPEVAAERLWRAMWPKLAANRAAWDAIESPWNERFLGRRIGRTLAAGGCLRTAWCHLTARGLRAIGTAPRRMGADSSRRGAAPRAQLCLPDFCTTGTAEGAEHRMRGTSG
jgi:hypothetical protein